ncbi:MAG: DUF2314 domain-containing protein [Methanobrevibacter sp.]|nr:DUF2314 domain-containing protein [Methanobrevibacter sp.]
MKEETFEYGNTPQMADAYKNAQNTFKYFWRELYWENCRIVPGHDLTIVKVEFTQETMKESTQETIKEYMWIGDIDFDGIHVKGTLLNEPNELTNIKEGDSVEIPLSKIADWMFSIDQKVYGGFTVQTIRSEMNEKEREEHDDAWGLNFQEPDEVLIVYDQEEHPENLIEHPMSRDMKEECKKYLSENPKELEVKDELGYTALHIQAIAGNKSWIEALLEMESDINAKTNDGYTALDFAQKLEWEHIIPILKKY